MVGTDAVISCVLEAVAVNADNVCEHGGKSRRYLCAGDAGDNCGKVFDCVYVCSI